MFPLQPNFSLGITNEDQLKLYFSTNRLLVDSCSSQWATFQVEENTLVELGQNNHATEKHGRTFYLGKFE